MAAVENGALTGIDTAFGSGDEAGGGAPQSTQASPRFDRQDSPRMSHCGSMQLGEGSFSEYADRLHKLLSENKETVFLEEWELDARPDNVSASTQASQIPVDLAAQIDQALIAKNLDTGETRCVLEDIPSFFGRPEDPKALAGSHTKAWDGLRQELRQNNEALWKAAETGSTQRLCDLLAPSWTIMEDPSGEASIEFNGAAYDRLQMLRDRGWKLSDSASMLEALESPVGSQKSSPERPCPPEGSGSVIDGSGASEKRSVSFADDEKADAGGEDPSGEKNLVPPGMMKVTVDSRSLHGRTALHIAASNGQAECMEMLLRARADIDARTDAGFTALHLACERGCLAAVKGLLVARCDTTMQTKQAELGLHLAAAKGHTGVLSVLLQVCTHDLLGVRNSYGQRPSEVSHDAETNVFLHSIVDVSGHDESALSSSSLCSSQDSYAGRTQFNRVLLRNSRADTVHRLLLRTGADPKLRSQSFEANSGDAAAGSCVPRRRSTHRSLHRTGSLESEPERRQCFSKLREENSEAVGPDSFSLKSVLGKGSFGEVYQVVHRSSGEIYAMKVLRKSKIFGRNLVRYAMTERNLLSYIRHPFIVRLHYAFQTPTCLVLVLHYCPGGNLSQLIVHEGRLPEAAAQLFIAEVFLAIEYLHERQVVYRDLKPENVVLNEDGHAMLTDFGLSKEGVEGMQGTKSFCGSVAYLAPEILARRGHGPTVDLYGIGVLLFEMLSGRPPYYSRDRETLFRNIISATLNVPSTASSRATSLIHRLMCRDPAQRLGALNTSEVRTHPFFYNLNFEAVLNREVPIPPLRRQRREKDFSSSSDKAKVASPFEGRLEAQVRRSWSSTSQEINGWEFGADTRCDGGSPPQSRTFPAEANSSRSAEGGSKRRSQRQGGAHDEWLGPTFF